MACFLPKTLDELRLHDPSGACVRYTTAGVPYEELSCLYPSIGWTYFGFEKNFDSVVIQDWVKTNSWALPFGILFYLGMITVGQKYFEDRKPLNWRRSLIAWNLLLTVFSTWGFLRTLPAFLHSLIWLQKYDWWCTAPENSVLSGSTGMWIQLWVISKFPEFLDTAFLIVHKKKIMFLHKFHHLLTFGASLYAFQRNTSPPPMIVVGIMMNYAVHSVMYLYYMLMAMKCKPKWFNPFWITAAQLGQMVVGFGLALLTLALYKNFPGECQGWLDDVVRLAVFAYASFFLLFAKLFFGRYYAIEAKRKTV